LLCILAGAPASRRLFHCRSGDAVKPISSKSSFAFKRLFPIAWFGFLAFFIIQTIATDAYKRDPIFLAAPCLMALAGYFVMKKVLWDLADEVIDEGDFLRVRRGQQEERVPLAGIINVNSSTYSNPPRITLRLATPGKFGSEIAFTPVRPFSLNPFARNAVAEELIVRVDQARRRGVAAGAGKA
jgi:hypothetical protein